MQRWSGLKIAEAVCCGKLLLQKQSFRFLTPAEICTILAEVGCQKKKEGT